LRTTNVREAVRLSRKYTCFIMCDKKKGKGWMKISGYVSTGGSILVSGEDMVDY